MLHFILLLSGEEDELDVYTRVCVGVCVRVCTCDRVVVGVFMRKYVVRVAHLLLFLQARGNEPEMCVRTCACACGVLRCMRTQSVRVARFPSHSLRPRGMSWRGV